MKEYAPASRPGAAACGHGFLGPNSQGPHALLPPRYALRVLLVRPACCSRPSRSSFSAATISIACRYSFASRSNFSLHSIEGGTRALLSLSTILPDCSLNISDARKSPLRACDICLFNKSSSLSSRPGCSVDTILTPSVLVMLKPPPRRDPLVLLRAQSRELFGRCCIPTLRAGWLHLHDSDPASIAQ